MDKRYIITGSILAGLAVVIGAFGAHALEPTLEMYGKSETYDTGVQYHMFHSLAILFVGLLLNQKKHRYLHWAAGLFVIGTIIFSGSLYILSITNYTLLGAITPIGGLCFIAGWVVLTYYLFRYY